MLDLNHLLTHLLQSFCASPLLFLPWSDNLLGLDLSIVEVSRSHSDTPHSVGLLWTKYRPVAETSTWKHKTLTTDRHPSPGGIRTHNPSKRTDAHPRLRPRGHWDRPPLLISEYSARCSFQHSRFLLRQKTIYNSTYLMRRLNLLNLNIASLPP
jgi:hypothetical protein